MPGGNAPPSVLEPDAPPDAEALVPPVPTVCPEPLVGSAPQFTIPTATLRTDIFSKFIRTGTFGSASCRYARELVLRLIAHKCVRTGHHALEQREYSTSSAKDDPYCRRLLRLAKTQTAVVVEGKNLTFLFLT